MLKISSNPLSTAEKPKEQSGLRISSNPLDQTVKPVQQTAQVVEPITVPKEDRSLLKTIGNMFTSAGKSSASSFGNQFTKMYEYGNANRIADTEKKISEMLPYVTMAKASYDSLMGSGNERDIAEAADNYYLRLYNLASAVDPTALKPGNDYASIAQGAIQNSSYMQDLMRRIEEAEKGVKAGTMSTDELIDYFNDFKFGKGDTVYEKAVNESYKLQDTMAQSAAEDLEKAIAYNPVQNGLGQTFVKGGTSMLQSTADALLGGVTGTGMLPFYLRASGGASQEARQMMEQMGTAGDPDALFKQSLYGAKAGAIELLTESMWGMAGAMGHLKNGALDDATRGVIGKAISGLAKTDVGRRILSTLSDIVVGGAFEGVEEVVGDVLGYIFKIEETYGGESELTKEQLLEDFLTGAMSGILGGPTNITNSTAQYFGDKSIGQSVRSTENFNEDEFLGKQANGAQEDTARELAESAIQSKAEGRTISDAELGSIARAAAEDENARIELANKLYEVASTENADTSELKDTLSDSRSVGLANDLFKAGITNDMTVEERQNAFTEATRKARTENVQNVSATRAEEVNIGEESAIADSATANDQDTVYKTMRSLGYADKTARIFADTYAPESVVTASDYIIGMNDAYRQGYTGAERMTKRNAKLTEAQRNFAYETGRASSAVQTIPRTARDKARTGKVVYDGVDVSTLTDRQKTSASAISRVVSKVTKNTVHFFASEEVNGKRVFSQDVAGHKKGEVAPNGFYLTGKGDVYIDINAGNGGEGTMLWTAAHEFTHFIKDNSPEQFKTLADFLVNEYGKAGVDVDDLVKAQMAKDTHNTDRSYNERYELAYEEMVADSMQTMFTDTNLMEKLERLSNTDRSLVKKIADFLKELQQKITELYKGLASQTAESYHVRQMKDSIDKLSDMFAKALTEAGNTYASTEAVTSADLKDSIRSYSSAVGIDARKDKDGVIKFYFNGKPISKVSAEHVAASPMGALIKEAKKNGFIDDSAVREQCKAVADIMNMILKTNDPDQVWAYTGSMMFSALKANSDPQYTTTVDFTTVCRKTQNMITAMSEAMLAKGSGLTKDEVAALQKKIAESKDSEGRNLTVPCPVCYVFSRWAGAGKTLDSIWNLQEKYAKYDIKDIRKRVKELRPEIQKLQDNAIDENGEKVKLSEGKGAKVLYGLTRDAYDKLSDKIEKLETLGDKEGQLPELRKRQKAMEQDLSILDEYTWAKNIVTDPKYEPVPKDILYNLDKGAEFATRYPVVWKYRTTRGPSSGKAIVPYSDMRFGDIILGEKNNSSFTKRDKNDIPISGRTTFTEEKNGELVSKVKVVDGQAEFGKTQNTAIKNALKRVAAQNLIGGQRFQSTSDFRYEYALDYIQAFFELQALGSNIQTYTKVVEFADMIAAVGGDVNLSVMPLGKGYKDGKLVYSNVTGMDIEAAKEAAHKFPNAQLILVGINDEHIMLALDDFNGTGGEEVGFVIPYHTSGASIEDFIRILVDNLGEEWARNNYKDYSKLQTDHVREDSTEKQKRMRDIRQKMLMTGQLNADDLAIIKGESKDITGRTFDDLRAVEVAALSGDKDAISEYKSWSAGVLTDLYKRMHESNARLSKQQSEMIMPHEYWNKSTTRGNAYVNGFIFRSYCYNLGLDPRFTGMADSGKRLDYGDFSNSTGYWKTLIDRPMYDLEGNYRDQQRVNVTKFKTEMLTKDYAEQNYGKYKVAEPQEEQARQIGRDFGEKLSVREEEPPTKTKKAYKLMRLVNGELHPLFIGNNEVITPGTWYNADSPNLDNLKFLEPGTHLINMETGEATSWADYAKEHNVKRTKPNKDDVHWATDNGYRFMEIVDKAGEKSEKEMLQKYGDTRAYYNWGVNGSKKSENGEGDASLYALRPGWHFGEVPSMRQIGYTSESGEKDMRLDNQVWVEVEMAADIDYNDEARSNASGDIPTHIPTNGYYMYATNPTQKKSKSGKSSDLEKANWFVAGAFKVNRILSDYEADRIVEEFNAKNGTKIPLDYRRNGGRVFNAETMSLEDGEKFSFRGEKSALQTGDDGKLDIAKDMYSSGIDMDRIRIATGWYRQSDGKWRSEFSDKRAKLIGEAATYFVSPEERKALFAEYQTALKAANSVRNSKYSSAADLNNAYNEANRLATIYNEHQRELLAKQKAAKIAKGLKLKDVLHFPELYKYYPGLKNVNVEFDKRMTSTVAYWYDYNNTIKISLAFPQEDPVASVLHEIQHAIQNFEGFAYDWDRPYKQRRGEIESFDVEARHNMTDKQRLATPPQKFSERVLMGSLFSGSGTLEAGLVYQMVDKEFAVEYNRQIASVYMDNNGKEHMFVGDVRDFDSKKKRSVFYLHASPVCKNYSNANHKGGETTLDIDTAKATARVLEEQMPTVFTVENVKRYIGSEAYNLIVKKLKDLGYEWDVNVYKASDYGNATKRERMFIRAVRGVELPDAPQKTRNKVSWGEATRDLWDTELEPSYLVRSKIEGIKNTEELRGIDLNHLDQPLMIYDTTKSKKVTFAWADELAPTLTTKCGDARIIMPDGKVYKPTPKFMGRIQGLPDNYKYPKAETTAFKVIGNGIPTQLTSAVSGELLDSAYEQTYGEELYSERDDTDNRTLLANALESAAVTDAEKNLLAEYKAKVESINAKQVKLNELSRQIRELSFAPGKRDTAKLTELRGQAQKLANSINLADKRLLQLESTKVLRGVLDREKSNVERRMRQKINDLRKTTSVSRQKRELRDRIERHVNNIATLITQPSDKKHIMKELQAPVARLLEAINTESTKEVITTGPKSHRMVEPGTEGAHPTKRTQAFRDLREILSNYKGELVIDPDLFGQNVDGQTIGGKFQYIIEDLADKPISTLGLDDLNTIWEAVAAIESAIRSADKLFNEYRWKSVSELANAIKRDNDGKKQKTMYGGPVGFLQNITSMDMLTPQSYMHMLGDTGDNMFKMLRSAQDKQIQLIKESTDYNNSLFKDVDVNGLEKEMHTVKLGGKDHEMSTAQLIELYCLMQRPAAMAHLEQGGILIEERKAKGLKRNVDLEATRNISQDEYKKAVSIIENNPKLKALADKMQNYLSTDIAKWGNDASMAIYGYEKFGEKYYWPMRSSNADLRHEQGKSINEARTVSSKGFTYAPTPGANTALKIGSAFQTYTDHIANMAVYNAWLGTAEDINRVRNYKWRDDKGKRLGNVAEIINRVHGEGGVKYIDTLMGDVASGTQAERTYLDATLGAFKAASVGANLRVILQQPTAIFRALSEIRATDLTAGAANSWRNGWKKAVKYSPIAQWKDWGYFDIRTGRQVRDIILGSDSKVDKAKEKMMAGAALADSIGWGWLWNSCEADVRRTNRNLWEHRNENDAFYEKVAEKFADVVDKTQVVDGILQRSQAMRDPSAYMKMTTSFMGEPTKQYNMILQAAYDARNKLPGSNKKLAMTCMAFLVSGVVNVLAQSIADAWRDDDKDKKYLERVFEKATGIIDGEYNAKEIATSNLGSMLNPMNYIVYLKDIESLIEGYDVERTDMAVINDVLESGQKLAKAINGEGKYSLASAITNFTATLGKLFGIPATNINRDAWGLIGEAVAKSGNYVLRYEMLKATRMEQNNKATYIDLLYNAYLNDEEQYRIIYDRLIEDDLLNTSTQDTATYIKKNLEKRIKERGASAKYDPYLSSMEDNLQFTKATADEQDRALSLLRTMISNGSADAAADKGISENELSSYAMQITLYDEPTDSGKYGTYTVDEVEMALNSVPGLTAAEKRFIWINIAGKSEKSCPWK